MIGHQVHHGVELLDRLKANDRVDPYVALYEHPSPSCVGNITRLRWSGLIGPAFLQSVIDIALYVISPQFM